MIETLLPVGSLSDVLHRATNAGEFDRWLRQVHSTGCCRHPVRLAGHASGVQVDTGELVAAFDTAAEPDGMVLKACGNRRATVCPTCSATYRADAYQLIHAGLAGGKGVPASIAAHPRVFVTLTAPSFGAVHSHREKHGRTRACTRRRTGTCPHDTPLRCRVRHAPDDPLIGRPLCPPCFDYTGAILWNATASELWRRTTIGIHRALARAGGLTVTRLRKVVRVSFGKVVEYQARGLVHIHAVIRLDAADLSNAPPAEFSTELLTEAIHTAAAAARAPIPTPEDAAARVCAWGRQVDVRTIPPTTADGSPGAASIARYIAKYSTKSTDPLGALDHRIRDIHEIETLHIDEHLRRLVATAWQLGGDPLYRPLRLRAWAHTLGYRGHWTTKSRTYSTTLGALRTARTTHARHTDGPDDVEWLGNFRYAGHGYRTPGDAWLAQSAANQRAHTRHTARTERRSIGLS